MEEMIAEATRIALLYREKLTWLAGWTIQIEPFIPGDENDDMDHGARIMPLIYIRHAKIQLHPMMLERHLGNDGGLWHSLEESILHELCHVLTVNMRYAAYNFAKDATGEMAPSVVEFVQDAEEPVMWHLVESIINLGGPKTNETICARRHRRGIG